MPVIWKGDYTVQNIQINLRRDFEREPLEMNCIEYIFSKTTLSPGNRMKAMGIREAIATLGSEIGNPNVGLPQDVFLFASRLLPLVNVDLLVKDNAGKTLLTWRDDQFAGTGWHLPGGILRFKETLEERLRKVAISELGTELIAEPAPMAMHQFIDPKPERKERGHFISFLYRCHVQDGFSLDMANSGRSPGEPGYAMWHAKCPDNLIKAHSEYRKYF